MSVATFHTAINLGPGGMPSSCSWVTLAQSFFPWGNDVFEKTSGLRLSFASVRLRQRQTNRGSRQLGDTM